jgi:hypothetical protein
MKDNLQKQTKYVNKFDIQKKLLQRNISRKMICSKKKI